MKRSIFLLIAAILSFAFGAMMFFAPQIAATILGLTLTPESTSLMHGMGGLIIGTGAMNYLLRNSKEVYTIKGVLQANILIHLLGLSADTWGVLDNALTAVRILPVEAVHLFIGIGSLIYLLKNSYK